jgi:sugar O-acyltransferase (sialic acid O-acetyltransferase NeuD family)
LIAGTGLSAEVILNFIEVDQMGVIEGFVVDGAFASGHEFLGRPLVALNGVEKHFPPRMFCAVNCIGYNNMNRVRGRISAGLRALGYDMPGFVHPSAMLAKSNAYGSNLIAMQGVVVEPCTHIGDDVVLWSACYVGHHSRIGDRVYVGPRAVIAGTVTIGDNSFIGANATVRSKTSVGSKCLVGAASYVRRDLKDRAVLLPPKSEVSERTSDDFDTFH